MDGDAYVFASCIVVPSANDSITLNSGDTLTISVWDAPLSLSRGGVEYDFDARTVYDIEIGSSSPGGTFAVGDVITFGDASPIEDTIQYGGAYGASVNEATERAKHILEASDSMFRFVRWQIDTGSGQYVGIYSDTIVSMLPAKDGEGNYLPQTLRAQLTDSAINVVLDPNTSDLDVYVEPPTEFLVFKSDDDKYRFTPNNVTRTGYRIIGWAWEADATSSSASFLSIGSEWVLTGDEEIYTYNSQGEKVLTLYAVWERIEYEITIVSPSGGTIVAECNGSTGTTFTVNYGEVITLNYIEGDGWTFNKWYINGEGSITNPGSPSTTLVVKGSCAVYAQLKGLEDVSVNVHLDGGASDPRNLDMYLSNDSGSTNDLIWRENVVSAGTMYGVFRTTCTVGTFYVNVVGSDGASYRVGEITVTSGGVVGEIDLLKFTDVPEHLNVPEYAVVGDVVDYTLDEFYELKEQMSGDYVGQRVVVLTWTENSITKYDASSGSSFTLPQSPDSAVTISANIGLVDHSVTMTVPSGFTIDPSTTIYEVQHGSTLSLPSIRDGSGHMVVTSSEPVTESNYLLVGWFTDAGYSQPFTSNVTTIGSDITLYPQIIEKSKVAYTVNIYQMGIDGHYPTTPLTIIASDNAGEQITYVAPVYVGFTLNPSSSEIAGTVAKEGLVLNLYYDRMYASGFQVSYGDGAPVSGYDTGLWTADGNVLRYTGIVYYGQTVELVSAIRTGHTWTGWDIDGSPSTSGTYTFSLNGEGTAVHVPVVSATYSVNSYTLTMVTPHGSFEGGVKSLSYSVPYGTILGGTPPTIYATEGYTFLDWELDGVPVPINMSMPAHDVTFVAVWQLNTYTLTFTGDTNVSLSSRANGSTVVTGATVSHGSQVILSMAFNGSYSLGAYSVTSAGNPVTLYDLGGEESLPIQGVNRQSFTWTFIMESDVDIDISSVLSQYVVTYLLSGVNSDSGWIAPSGSQWNTFLTKSAVEGDDISITEEPTVSDGYVFHGWYADQAMTSKITSISGISSDTPIYGKVVPAQYTIRFDGNGGTGSMSDIVTEYGKDVQIVNGYSMEGATFIGWYCIETEATLGNIVSNLTLTDGATLTLKAVWIINTSFTFDGSYHSIVVGEYGTAIWHYSESPISDSNHGSHDSVAKRSVGTYVIHVGLSDVHGNSLTGSGTLVITPKQLTESMVQVTGVYTYSDSVHNVILDVTDQGFIDVSDWTVSGTTSATAAGTYFFTVTAEGGNYVGEVTKQWVIGKKTVGLSLSNSSFTYYPDTVRTVSVIVSGTVGDDVVSATYKGTVSAIANGTYDVTVTGLVGDGSENYALPAITVLTWIITPSEFVVTENQYSGVYDGKYHSSTVMAEHVVTGPDDHLGEHQISIYYSLTELTAENYTDGSTTPLEFKDVCNLTIYYYITANHSVPMSGSMTFTITPKSIIGSNVVMGDDLIYDGTIQTMHATKVTIEGLTLVKGTDYVISQNQRSEVGTYKATFEGIGNFTGSFEREWSILPLTVTVTPNADQSKVYGDAEPEYFYSSTKSEAITGGTVSREAGESVGSYRFNLGSLTCDANHVLEITEAYFTISKREIKVTGSTSSLIYNGKVQSIVGFSAPDNMVSGHTLSGISYSATGEDIGTYDGQFTGEFRVLDSESVDVTSNYSLNLVVGTLTIEKKAVTVTANNLSVKYGEGVSLSAIVEGTYHGDTIEYTISREAGVNVGTYVITVSGESSQGNYVVTYVPGELEINPRSVTVTAQDASKAYGSSDPEFSATVVGTLNGDSISYELNRDSGDVVANYVLMPSGEIYQGNYVVLFVAGTFTITKADYDMTGVSFADKVIVYDGEEHSIAITGSLPVGMDGIAVDVSYSAGRTDVGMVTITATFSTESANYNVPSPMTAVLEVEKKVLEVVTQSSTKTYDGNPLSAGGTISGLVSGETATLECTGVITDVGSIDNTFVINWGTAKEGNYDIDADIGKLTINPRSLFITGDSDDVVYDRSTHSLSTYSHEGLVSDHSISGISYSVSGVDAKTYEGAFSNSAVIKAGDVDVTSNYKITTVPGELVIQPKPISECDVTKIASEMIYDGTEQSIGVQIKHGDYVLLSTDYSIVGNSATNAGTHTAIIEGIGNYGGSVELGWEIDHKAVTVTAEASNKTFGENDPEFTAVPEGLIGTDSVTYSVTRSSGDNAGTYAITPSGDKIQGNYDVTYVAGTFTIFTRDISGAEVILGPSLIYNGESQTQTVTGVTVDGLTVTYELSNNNDEDAGTYTLTVTGTGNFSGSVTESWSIEKKEVGLKLEQSSFVFDGTEKAPIITIQGVVGGDDLGVDVTGTRSATNADTYYLDVRSLTGSSASNYALPVSKTLKWSITNADIAVTICGYSGTYDGQSHEAYIEATAVSSVPTVYYAIVELNESNYLAEGSTNRMSFKDVGEYVVYYYVTAESCSPERGSIPVSISKRDITGADVTLGPVPTYNGESQTQTVTGVTVGDLTVTYGLSDNVGVDAGTYTLTVTGVGNFSGSVTKGWTIAKATYDMTGISFNDATYVYDGTPKSLVVNGTLPTGKDGIQVSVVYSANTLTDVSDLDVTATFSGSDNYHPIGSRVAKLSITHADLYVSMPSASKVYDGTPLMGAGSYNGLVDGETFTFTPTGSIMNVGVMDNGYSIDWNGTAKRSNYAIHEDIGKLTVTKATYDMSGISFDDVTRTYDGTYMGIEVAGTLPTGKDGVQVTVSYDHTYKDVGKHVIVATFSTASDNYDVPASKSATLTIEKRLLTIATHDGQKTYDGTPLTVSTYDVSGLATGDQCIVTTTGTRTDYGVSNNTYNLRWGDSTDGSNYEVTSDLGTLRVLKKDVTITGESASIVYDGGVHAYDGITVEGLIDGHSYSGIGYSVGGTGAGTYNGTFSGAIVIMLETKDVTHNYNVNAPVPGTLIISKKALEDSMLSLATTSLVYNGAEQTIGYQLSDGTILDIDDYVLTGHVGKDAGPYTIMVTSTDDGNYSGSIEKGWAITKKVLTITGTTGSLTYNGAERTITTFIASGLVDGHRATGLQYRAAGTDVGTYGGNFTGTLKVLDFNSVDVTSNYEYTQVVGTLTIDPLDIKDATVVLGNNIIYNGYSRTQVVSSVRIGDLVVKYEKAGDSGTDAGSYEMTLTGVGNFTGTKNVKWTIAKAPLTVTADDCTITFEDAVPTFTVKYSGFANGDDEGELDGTLTFDCDYQPGGEYSETFAITPSGLSADNYEITFVAGTLSVNKKVIPIPVSVTGLIYNGSKQVGVVGGYGYSVVDNEAKGAGNHTATVTLLKDGYVWNDSTTVPKDIVWSIGKKSVTITTGSDSKVYDGSPLTATGSAEGIVPGEFEFSTTGAITDVGVAFNTYSLVWRGDATGDNYVITENLGKLTVTERTLTIVTESVERAYNGTPLTATGTVTGLVDGEVISVTYTGNITNVGSVKNTYVIDWGTVNESNYVIDETIGDLTVTYAHAFVTLKADQSKTYGADEPAKYEVIIEGTFELGALTYVATRVAGEDVGTYDVTITGAAHQGNYMVTFVGGTFSITKALLTVIAHDKNVVYTENTTAFTAVYSGFVNGENESVLGGSLSFACGYSPTGAYGSEFTIVPGGLISDNYDIEFVNGTLHVSEKQIAKPNAVSGIIYNGEVRTGVMEGIGYERSGTYSAIDAGTYTSVVTLKDGYAWTYENSNDITIEWTIAKRGVELYLSHTIVPFTGAEVTVSVNVRNVIVGDDVHASYTGNKGTAAGTYAVNVSSLTGTDADNYLLPAITSLSWEISNAELIVDIISYTGVYDGSYHNIVPTITVVGSGGYTEYYSDVPISGSNYESVSKPLDSLKQKDVGSYTIYYYVVAPSHGSVTGSGTIAITQKQLTIDVYDTIKRYGGAEPEYTAKVTGLIGSDVIGYEFSREAGEAVGEYAIGVINISDANNYAVITIEGKLTILPKLLTAQMLNIGSSLEYKGYVQNAPFSLKDGSYELIDGADFTIMSNGTATDAGSYTLTITGKGNYDGSVSKVWNITRKPVTVTGGSSTHVYDGLLHENREFTVSELITGHTYDDSLTYYARKLMSGTHKGEFTGSLKVFSGGVDVTGNYHVTYVSGYVEVTKKALDLSMLSISGSYVYNGSEQYLAYTVSDVNDALFYEDYTVTGHYAKNAGTYSIVITATSDGDYTGQISREWTIDKRTVTITGASGEVVYNGESQVLTDYDASGIVVGHVVTGLTYRVGGTIAISYTGAFTGVPMIMSGTEDVTNNYDITLVVGSLRILPKDITGAMIVLDDELVYNGQNQKQGISSITVDGILVTQYTVVGDTAKMAGTYTMVVSGGSNFVGQLSIQWKINPKEITVTTYGGTHTYDGTPFTMGGNVEGIMDGANSYRLEILGSITDVGSISNVYNLMWTTANPANYVVKDNVGTLTVIPRDISDAVVTLGPEHTYNGNSKVQTIESVRIGSLVVDYKVNGYIATNAGEYTMTITGVGNFEGTLLQSWQILKRELTGAMVTVSGTYVYDGTEQTVSYTVKDIYRMTVDDYTVSGTNQVNAGSYMLTVEATIDGNYSGVVNVPWSIGKRMLTIATTDAEKVYDGMPLTADGSIIGHVIGDIVSFNTIGSITDVGFITNGYEIVWKDATTYNNYELVEDLGTLTVVKRQVSLTGESVSVTYDGNVHTFDGISVSGLVVGQKYSGIAYAVSGKDAGIYDGAFSGTIQITMNGADVTSNYDVTFSTGVLTIEKRSLDDGMFSVYGTYIYNGTEQNVSYDVSDGTALGDTDYTVTGHVATDAGDHIITIIATDTGNYSGTLTKKWEIQKRVVTITGDSFEREYNRAGYNLSGFTVDGIVSGHHLAGITHLVSGVHVGTYDGHFTGMPEIHTEYELNVIDNYDITMVTGSLTIVPLDISFAQVTFGVTLTYNGTEQAVQILSVEVGGIQVRTYDIIGGMATNAGTYTLTIVGTGNYVGTVEKSWGIKPLDISDANIVLGPDVVFDGSMKTQSIESVIVDGLTVTYEVTGNTAVDVGDYVLTVTGTGNFRGFATSAWSILEPPEHVTVVWPEGTYVYNGEVQEIKITLTTEDGTPIPYHLEYYDLNGNEVEFRDVGTYVVKVVVDDTRYIIDGSATITVQILADEPEDDRSTGINIWVILLALAIAALAAYLPISYLFGFDMRRWMMILAPIVSLVVVYLLVSVLIKIESDGPILIAAIAVAALAAYLPISYLYRKR